MPKVCTACVGKIRSPHSGSRPVVPNKPTTLRRGLSAIAIFVPKQVFLLRFVTRRTTACSRLANHAFLAALNKNEKHHEEQDTEHDTNDGYVIHESSLRSNPQPKRRAS